MTFITNLVVTFCMSVSNFECHEFVVASWASDSKPGQLQDMADCLNLGDKLYADQAWECQPTSE